MKQIAFEAVDSPEGGFEARAIGYSIFTQGEDWEDLKAMVQDAVRCHFDDVDGPAEIRLRLMREEVISA